MRFLLLLLPFLAQQGPDPSRLPTDPIKDWKYQRKDVNAKGIEEVSMLLEGREALVVDRTKDREVVNITDAKVRYFTTPKHDKDPSEEIDLRADRAVLNNGQRTLKMDGNVRASKPDGTLLRAPTALLRFNRSYECPVCKTAFPFPGNCPEHKIVLKEKALPSVEAERDFDLAMPEGILTGEGLVTDDALRREYHVKKDGFVEIAGVPAALSSNVRSPAANSGFTQIHSKGPLHVTGDDDHRRISGTGGVRVDRIDATGSLQVRSRELVLATQRRDDDGSGKPGPLEPRTMDADGEVRMEGVNYADGTAFEVTSDTLAWERQHLSDAEIEIARLSSAGRAVLRNGPSTVEAPRMTIDRANGLSRFESDAPATVRVRTGESVIECRRVLLDQPAGRGLFEEVFQSDLRSGTDRFTLKCDVLSTQSAPKGGVGDGLRSIEARNHVVLGGLLEKPGEDPGRAEADLFVWDNETKKGRLEATPRVRIVQGASLITAPKVILESPDIIVLKGPKQLRLRQPSSDGPAQEYRATCEGDLVLDQKAHRLEMRNACVLRTSELDLHSDRVHGILSADNKGLESLLAAGGVQAWRTVDHTRISGDRLAYRFSDKNLRVYGNPYAIADAGRSLAVQEEIRVFERPHPKTGLPVRYTEMIGSRDGVRLQFEEKGK